MGCLIPHCVLGYPFSWVEVATLVREIVISVSLLAGERPLSPDKEHGRTSRERATKEYQSKGAGLTMAGHMADDVVDFTERGNRDSTMIGESDRVDGLRVANRQEVGNDCKDVSGMNIRELFAEDRSKWWTGRKS